MYPNAYDSFADSTGIIFLLIGGQALCCLTRLERSASPKPMKGRLGLS